jgi:mRNA interferase RelE/StbE
VSYTLLITRQAQRELSELDPKSYVLVKSEILILAENQRPRKSRKLVGREGWRIRSGNYRIIYEINDHEKKVTILHIGHRRDVYK